MSIAACLFTVISFDIRHNLSYHDYITEIGVIVHDG